jgi:hypothetical protein
MKITNVNVPIFTLTVEEHQEIKPELLSMLDKSEFQNLNNVSRSDFFIKKSQSYKEYIIQILKSRINTIFPQVNLRVTDCWFQQYEKFSYHEWHTHRCDWACVYYLELPKGSQGTVFKDYFGSEEIRPQVSEGDLIVFPGWFIHRSPVNKSLQRKTIISLNLEQAL